MLCTKTQFLIILSVFTSVILIFYLGSNNNLQPHQSSNNSVSNTIKRHDTLVIIPSFTALAYGKSGFYDYFSKKCKDCISVKIDKPEYNFASSVTGIKTLTGQMNYESISDIDLQQKLMEDKKFLAKYQKIIVLHNEYVTNEIFVAVTSHNKVIYLYPNALYAKIEMINDTMKLVRGHGYPDSGILNGFDWKLDNSKLEYDRKCENVKFYEIKNGYMLNCYPENIMQSDEFLEILDKL